MEDQILYCRHCGREFTFTVGEQEFYARKQLMGPPGRCPDCRGARRQGGRAQHNGWQRGNGSYGGYAAQRGASSGARRSRQF